MSSINLVTSRIKSFFTNKQRLANFKISLLFALVLLIINLIIALIFYRDSLYKYFIDTNYLYLLPVLFYVFSELRLAVPVQDKKLLDIDNGVNRVINIVDNSGEIHIESDVRKQLTSIKDVDSFLAYFTNVITYLESKSIDSDKKASVLLDNGKTYSVTGIAFFILATIGWQIYITTAGEMKSHHIYGIIATSLLFIFIEFLSAWYLRQYKSFTDTATYLTKIKSIFDKYMLIYLVSVEKGDNDFSILLEQLSSEIKWPETYLLKNLDVSFAKEALETMTTMAQAFKKETTNSKGVD